MKEGIKEVFNKTKPQRNCIINKQTFRVNRRKRQLVTFPKNLKANDIKGECSKPCYLSITPKSRNASSRSLSLTRGSKFPTYMRVIFPMRTVNHKERELNQLIYSSQAHCNKKLDVSTISASYNQKTSILFPCKKYNTDIAVKFGRIKQTKNLKCNHIHYSTEEQQRKNHNQRQYYRKINSKKRSLK